MTRFKVGDRIKYISGKGMINSYGEIDLFPHISIEIEELELEELFVI